jgi:hypothetical protein
MAIVLATGKKLDDTIYIADFCGISALMTARAFFARDPGVAGSCIHGTATCIYFRVRASM